MSNSQQPQRKPGRPKTLPTMSQIFEEVGVVIEECEACGAKPATYRHYAKGRILCRKCARPHFRRHLERMLAAGAVLVLAVGFVWFI